MLFLHRKKTSSNLVYEFWSCILFYIKHNQLYKFKTNFKIVMFQDSLDRKHNLNVFINQFFICLFCSHVSKSMGLFPIALELEIHRFMNKNKRRAQKTWLVSYQFSVTKKNCFIFWLCIFWIAFTEFVQFSLQCS
jgi:hypothetical protein